MKKDLILGDSILELPSNGALRPGQMYFANAERITESNFSEGTTAYMQGWRDPENIEQTIIDIAGQPVPVGRRFEYGTQPNAEAFLSELDDERATGSSFKRVEYTGDKVNAKTKNYGLLLRLDRDNLPQREDSINLAINRTSAKLKQRVMRNKLRRVVTALSAIDNSPVAKVWSTASGKDPDGDAAELIMAAGDTSGMNPNTLLYGQAAWLYRFLSLRAQNQTLAASATLTPEQLAMLLQVEKIKISKERFQSSATGKSKVVGDVLIAYYRSAMPDMDDPSNIKVFTSATSKGGDFAAYVVDDGVKFIDVIVEHYCLVVAVATVGAKKYTVTKT